MNSRKAFCETDQGDIYYWTLGSGPPVLLLHQATQSSAEFKGIAPLLAARHQVIAFDYLGHGFSDSADHELSVPEFCDGAIAVLDAVGAKQVHLVGHHSGGILATQLAVDHAERVSKLVTSGLGIHTDAIVQAFFATPMTRDLPVDADGDFLKKTWDVYRRMSSPGLPPEKSFEFFIVGLIARTRPYDAHYEFMRWDRDEAMRQVRQPTLMICGEHDDFVEDPQTLTELVGDSRYVSVPGGGAFLFYEQPEACAELLLEFFGEN